MEKTISLKSLKMLPELTTAKPPPAETPIPPPGENDAPGIESLLDLPEVSIKENPNLN